jgi:hypothetical protein
VVRWRYLKTIKARQVKTCVMRSWIICRSARHNIPVGRSYEERWDGLCMWYEQEKKENKHSLKSKKLKLSQRWKLKCISEECIAFYQAKNVTFRWNLMLTYLTIRMEEGYSKTLIPTYDTTWRLVSGDHNRMMLSVNIQGRNILNTLA